jgi:hypothetical protein
MSESTAPSAPGANGVNHFDADAYLGTLERPTLTVGGRAFNGRFLGVEDWLRFAPRLDALAQGALPPTAMKALIRDLTCAIFPPPAAWKLWTWGRPFAYSELRKMPLAVQLRALEHFTRSQATALNPANYGRTRNEGEAPPAQGSLEVSVTTEAATPTTPSASTASSGSSSA